MHKETNLFQKPGKIDRSQREIQNGNRSFTLWLTGLPGAGTTTLAQVIENWLFALNKKVYILDGDNIPSGINSDLSIYDKYRTENTRRIAEVSRLFNDAGIIVIAALISPFRADRETARKIIGEESFIEIYVDTSLITCLGRDTKNLYKLAEEGKIADFTGISSRNESPPDPQIHPQSDISSIEKCLNEVKEHLVDEELLGPLYQLASLHFS